tara:strand:- start:777 stop:2087 length:1311 start_codon:yes stop_codon:yes gene_type:complete
MENEVQENVEVKAVEETPSDALPQNKEAAVLEKAVEAGDVKPEYGLQDDGVYKINVDNPPTPKKEIKEEPKKEKENAVQKSEPKESVLRDERPEVGLQEVGSEVRDESNKENLTEEKQAPIEKEKTDSPLELIIEEDNKADVPKEIKEAPADLKPKKELQEEKIPELPEGVNKLMKFIEETGGTVEDYAKLNKDYSKMDNLVLLREYYEFTKPHLDKEDINFLMDKNFAYDKELDDPSDIKAKQLAFKEELYNAQNALNGAKEKYYTDLKLRKKNDIPKEYQEALVYYNKTQQLLKEEAQVADNFLEQTKNVFNNDFKGFDFKVGESKYRVKIDNTKKIQEFQSDINNFLNQFVDDKGVTDARKYHKALYTAQNADKIANHFYEQGRADAIKESAKKAKNINMDPRSDASSVVTKSGDTIRVISGDSSDKLRIKWK